MQNGVVFVDSKLYSRDFPDAMSEVLPGVSWGLDRGIPNSGVLGLPGLGQRARARTAQLQIG
ncbi:hypothetical protein PspTeo4_24880 [Pseudomonas sp. Teo4]|nr:hypothetical protein [Pseudomonas sp. Teo4]